jgi:hypothetical protein
MESGVNYLFELIESNSLHTLDPLQCSGNFKIFTIAIELQNLYLSKLEKTPNVTVLNVEQNCKNDITTINDTIANSTSLADLNLTTKSIEKLVKMISTFGLSTKRFYVSFLPGIDDHNLNHQYRFFNDFCQLFFNSNFNNSINWLKNMCHRTIIKSLVYKRLLDNTNPWHNELFELIEHKIIPLKDEDDQQLDDHHDNRMNGLITFIQDIFKSFASMDDEDPVFRFVIDLFPDERFKIHLKAFLTDLKAVYAIVPLQIKNASTAMPLFILLTYLSQLSDIQLVPQEIVGVYYSKPAILSNYTNTTTFIDTDTMYKRIDLLQRELNLLYKTIHLAGYM